MKRFALLLLTASLTLSLCACSNPLKAASDAAESAIESTTTTNVILSDASEVPSLVIYDPNDNTQIALTLTPYDTDWHYLDEDGNEQTISQTDAVQSSSETSSASGDASGDAASAADSSASSSGDVSSLVAAADLDLPELPAEDSEIYYVIDTGATPDSLVQTSWKSEYIGDESADAMEIYTKLSGFSTLPMKAGRIYEIVVTWDEENFGSRGYYGTLTYLFVTVSEDEVSESSESGDAS